MKKASKIFAAILCLVMLLSVPALAADWTQYQKDGAHNGTIDTAPYTTYNSSSLSAGAHLGTITLGSGGWSGVDSEALMLTEDTTTYAYVTYNGGPVTSTIGSDGGTRLAKIDVTTMNGTSVNPTSVWDIQLTQANSFQLSTPCYFNNKLYVAGSGLSQLLQNNELVGTYNSGTSTYSYANWTVSTTGTRGDGYIRLTGNKYALLTSDLTSLTSGYNHRAAVGIKLGTSAPASATATVIAYAITSGGTSTTLGTYTFSPTATDASFRPILDDDGYYYYYLNENIDTTINNTLTAGSYKIRYRVTMTNNTGNSVDVEYCSFYEQNTTLFEISNITGTTAPSSSAIVKLGTSGGQINTPITAYSYTSSGTTHNCIYFGTYNGSKSYYQYDLGTGTLKTFAPSYTTTGYYWAGAYSDGTSVAFGSDNGYLCYTTAANFGTTKQEYNLSSYSSVTDPGNIRSSICKYGNYIYFTSQGGTGTSYLWRVYWPNIASLSSSDVSVIQLSGGSATSTPVISANGYIYVGTYGSATYSNNGVRAIPVSSFNASSVKNVVSGTGSGTSGTNYAVQSSVIVYSSGSYDYVYFTTNQHSTTNAVSGRGFCYMVNTSSYSSSKRWDSGNGNFTLQGMSAANGYLVFGNDAHTFYVIKP